MITNLLGKKNWWSVIVATLLGVPMYADIFGTLPIAEALVNKGVGLGTALSLPSFIMLKKVVKMPLLVLFTGIVSAGIIINGVIKTLYRTSKIFLQAFPANKDRELIVKEITSFQNVLDVHCIQGWSIDDTNFNLTLHVKVL